MNESEADILRQAAEPLSFVEDDVSELSNIARQFFEKGVVDMVIITLGAKVSRARDIRGVPSRDEC